MNKILITVNKLIKALGLHERTIREYNNLKAIKKYKQCKSCKSNSVLKK